LNSDGKYIPQLDFVRTVAVLLVFVGHLVHTLGFDRAVGTLAHFGVELFFIHTALVLFLSLERIGGNFSVFYLRRAFRIYPLSIITVLLALVFRVPATSWGAHYAWPGWLAVVSNLLLIQNLTGQTSIITVLWSLPVEVQMYVLLPALFLLYQCRVSVYIIWIAFAGLAFALPAVPQGDNFFLYGPCFCSGIIAYRVMKDGSSAISFRAMAYGLAGVILMNQVFALTRAPLAVSHSVVCIFAGLLIGRSRAPQTPAIRRLSAIIAKYSYGIYLSHVPLLWLCFRNKQGIPQFAAFTVGAVVLPFLAFHLVEAPLIRLGAALTRPKSSNQEETGTKNKSPFATYAR